MIGFFLGAVIAAMFEPVLWLGWFVVGKLSNNKIQCIVSSFVMGVVARLIINSMNGRPANMIFNVAGVVTAMIGSFVIFTIIQSRKEKREAIEAEKNELEEKK
jgi:mannitol-specific phosphotransferase system IIBC component